jgi:hypothetical protein
MGRVMKDLDLPLIVFVSNKEMGSCCDVLELIEDRKYEN